MKRFDTLLPEVNVLAKGLTNLIKISKERDMPALHEYLLHMPESNGRVSVHHQCRRKFTDNSSISPQSGDTYDVIIEQTKKLLKKRRRHF